MTTNKIINIEQLISDAASEKILTKVAAGEENAPVEPPVDSAQGGASSSPIQQLQELKNKLVQFRDQLAAEQGGVVPAAPADPAAVGAPAPAAVPGPGPVPAPAMAAPADPAMAAAPADPAMAAPAPPAVDPATGAPMSPAVAQPVAPVVTLTIPAGANVKVASALSVIQNFGGLL